MKREIIFTGKNYMQGDCQFFNIDKLPFNLKKIEKQFIAASERSGSFHAAFGDYELLQDEETGNMFIDAKGEIIINHSLKSDLEGISFDEAKILNKKDHRHTILPKGVYFVGIQNRIDPLSGIKKRVMD